jgi:glycosyltransferase involved in cell wall biosynthesis
MVIPGALEQLTGGYIYDARMVAELRRCVWKVAVHSLTGRFPGPDAEAERSLESVLSGLPDGATVVIDGLALGGLPVPAERHGPKLRLVALVHHPLCDETGLSTSRSAQLEALEGRALAACRGVIVSSAFTAQRLRTRFPAARPIVEVIPGTAPAARAQGPGPGHPPRLLCVGSVVPRKGQDLLVQALARLRDRPWECLIAGSLERDAAYARAVREAVRRALLDERVRFEGECSQDVLEALYGSSSLFVLPSWYEGYGMAFSEAMAHGLPVLATTGGAIPDTVPASAGLLVAPGDVEALGDALARLLDEPALRGSLAQGAWNHAQSLPDWPAAGSRFQRALEILAAA